MKIEEIHIYGYGKLENVFIDNLEDFQVFYGENEAGKSTIMAFIHGILFGFPTRQQLELRYEPKQGGKYGGRLKLRHPEYGLAIIERVRGKAAGDVAVTLADGTSGGEELVKKLLGNFDKGMFQAIFSFNLHGLQNVHQMKTEDIGRFLFSSGTLGTDRLAKTESELQKELDARFKPSGKKPTLNQKFAELKILEADLNKAADKNSRYESLLKEKEAVETRLSTLQGKIPEVQAEIRKLKEWLRIEDLAREEAILKDELQTYDKFEFPSRGMERLSSLKQMIGPYQAQIENLKERRAALLKEIDNLVINHELLSHESEVLAILEKRPDYDRSTQEELKIREEASRLDETIAVLKEKLHIDLTEEEIERINTDIYIKQQVEKAANTRVRLDNLKAQLDTSFHEEKAGLEKLESELKAAKASLLPRPEREKLEKASRVSNKAELQRRLEDTREKISLLEDAANDEISYQKRNKAFSMAVLVIGILLIGYGLTVQLISLAGIGLLCAILSITMFAKFSKSQMSGGKQAQLLKERQKAQRIEEELSGMNHAAAGEATVRLGLDDQQRNKVYSLEARLDQQNAQFEKVLSRFEQIEKEERELGEIILKLSDEFRISEKIGRRMILEAYRLIDEWKASIREKRRLHEKMDALLDIKSGIEDKWSGLSGLFGNSMPDDFMVASLMAKAELEAEKQKQIVYNEKSAKLEEIEQDLKMQEKEKEVRQLEIAQLLKQAGTEDEEAFYKLGELAAKIDSIKERLDNIGRELSYSSISEDERKALLQMNDVDERLIGLEQEAAEGEGSIKTLQTRLPELQHEIDILEEGGIYSELLHTFRLAKSEAEQEAKEWAVYQLAKELLIRTTDRFKDYHLPRMLKKAEEYLAYLTEGNYSKLYLAPGGNGFLIERKDHTRFEANELSQATTEQVYVAIRIALAETIYEKFTFPFIIDDSFVNFDGNRVKRVIELLKRFENRQVLFFTCHEHLLEHVDGRQVHRLGKEHAAIKG
ncbi:ATP-binding protein [Bacillus sp. EB01]|uniref:ATP-binding protein n=1 Tax=Bacillus sp. EB01 TaxID=1347086 RepID=UPI0005C52A90|nr:AAA family ATPase [Bacillus sp. EB01]